MRDRRAVVQSISYRIIKITSLISIIFSALFFVGGMPLGRLIYNSNDVGFLLRALSPIVPFMYLDAICDGILKGLDQQKFTFRTSVGDSAIRIILILLFLKRWGIFAFLGIMYFSNFLTAILNVTRLVKVSGLKLNLTYTFFLPLCSAFSICLITSFFLNLLPNLSNLIYIIILCVVCIAFYLVLLFAFGIVDQDDIGFIKRN